MEEGYQYSQYELTQGLRAPAEMTPLERQQELAGYDRPDHPRFTGDQKVRMDISNRMMALMRAGQPVPSDMARQLEKQGIRTPEDLEKITSDGFTDMDRAKAQREWDTLRNKLALQFPGMPHEEFNEMTGRAEATFWALREQNMLDDSFEEFIREGVGNEPWALQLFSDIGKLNDRFQQWKEKRGK